MTDPTDDDLESGTDVPSEPAEPLATETYDEPQAAVGRAQSAGPAGGGHYQVLPGECMESIADRHGFFWQTLWDHPDNQQLKNIRKDPNVLLVGDKVHIPELRAKEESGSTNQRHRFKRKGVPSKLRLVLLSDDKPRANVEYVLDVDGQLFSGKTDAQGIIEHAIPPNARQARLSVGTEGEAFELALGDIDPISELTGVQARLQNLGFDCDVTGEMDAETGEAIRAFQHKHGLPETGDPDDSTRQKLQQEHGS